MGVRDEEIMLMGTGHGWGRVGDCKLLGWMQGKHDLLMYK